MFKACIVVDKEHWEAKWFGTQNIGGENWKRYLSFYSFIHDSALN